MHQWVILTDVTLLLQLVISSSLIYALGNPSQAPTEIQTQVSSLRGGQFTNWAIPPENVINIDLEWPMLS